MSREIMLDTELVAMNQLLMALQVKAEFRVVPLSIKCSKVLVLVQYTVQRSAGGAFCVITFPMGNSYPTRQKQHDVMKTDTLGHKNSLKTFSTAFRKIA